MNNKVNLPEHIAIIMDGNRRWATLRGMFPHRGHQEGAKNLFKIVKACKDIGIKKLTVYAFSTENWNRLNYEIEALTKLIERYLKSEIVNINSQNIKFHVFGEKSKFGSTIGNLIESAENLTINNNGFEFSVGLNYGGRADILECVKSISKKIKLKELKLDEIDESIVQKNLISSKVSNIDLLIRTGGEQRISNFLFYQLAYSELFFTKTLWPDFTSKELIKILNKYSKTNRTFGASKMVLSNHEK